MCHPNQVINLSKSKVSQSSACFGQLLQLNRSSTCFCHATGQLEIWPASCCHPNLCWLAIRVAHRRRQKTIQSSASPNSKLETRATSLVRRAVAATHLRHHHSVKRKWRRHLKQEASEVQDTRRRETSSRESDGTSKQQSLMLLVVVIGRRRLMYSGAQFFVGQFDQLKSFDLSGQMISSCATLAFVLSGAASLCHLRAADTQMVSDIVATKDRRTKMNFKLDPTTTTTTILLATLSLFKDHFSSRLCTHLQLCRLLVLNSQLAVCYILFCSVSFRAKSRLLTGRFGAVEVWQTVAIFTTNTTAKNNRLQLQTIVCIRL